MGLAVGVGYLLIRRQIFRGGAANWTWDLAMLCALIVLLSPRAHKAHLAILIVPAGWIGAKIFRWIEEMDWQPAWKAHAPAMLAAAVMCALLIIAENVPVPVPGVFDQPYRCLGFFGLALMIGLVIGIGGWGSEESNGGGSSPPSPAHRPP